MSLTVLNDFMNLQKEGRFSLMSSVTKQSFTCRSRVQSVFIGLADSERFVLNTGLSLVHRNKLSFVIARILNILTTRRNGFLKISEIKSSQTFENLGGQRSIFATDIELVHNFDLITRCYKWIWNKRIIISQE